MKFQDIPTPEIYKESWDFRFFLKWIWACLTRVKYDTEHLSDIYDPLKCKEELLWMLGDTIGFKYDDRLPASFNRLVILYFMDMIRKKGSKSGVTFAAQANLAQFNLISYGAGYEDDDGNEVKGKDILYNRLEDTTIPSNSVYVSSHTAEGYIDVVYFSTEKPIDACIEYVRPLGMYCFQHSGVRFDSRTQISIDARLTDIPEIGESIGPTHIGKYTRGDYASIQKVADTTDAHIDSDNSLRFELAENRNPVWARNSTYEQEAASNINPGYRALYSLQLANNEHVVKALIDPHFSLGFGSQSDSDEYSEEQYYIKESGVTVVNPKSYLAQPYRDTLYTDSSDTRKYPEPYPYNLRYDRDQELAQTSDFTTLNENDETSYGTLTNPHPSVNPVMGAVGDAVAINDVKFTDVEDDSVRVKYLGIDEDE